MNHQTTSILPSHGRDIDLDDVLAYTRKRVRIARLAISQTHPAMDHHQRRLWCHLHDIEHYCREAGVEMRKAESSAGR